MMNQSQVMNPVHVTMHQMVMNQPPQVPHIVNRSNEIWLPPQQSSIESMNRVGFAGGGQSYVHRNWMRKRMDRSRRETARPGMKSVRLGHAGVYYRPPTLNDLHNQNQNRLNNVGRFHQNTNFNNQRSAPYAPRNTTSFLIRAKRSGGIADLVSPIPVTPSILSTPQLSPSREVLGDMVKEKWGVDDYGSMNGLIRLKSPEHVYEDEVEEQVVAVVEEEEDGGSPSSSSSGSDVEEHIVMEKKLDHDLSRFEMIYPNNGKGDENNVVLENRVNEQDNHISELEKENMLLREKLHLMENEMNDLRKMLQNLENHDDDDTILVKMKKMDG